MDPSEYERYLFRLHHLIYAELAQKVATLDYFSVHAVKLDPNPGKVELALPVIISGLLYDVTFSLFRLVDKRNSDRNIHHFLNVTEQVQKDIPWREPFGPQQIKNHRTLIEESSARIDRLIKRRNKFFAHYDKAYFYDEEALDRAVPFDIEDAKHLTEILTDIVLFYCAAFNGRRYVRNWQFVVYTNARRLYERIRGVPLPPC
jgi:AbiU2